MADDKNNKNSSSSVGNNTSSGNGTTVSAAPQKTSHSSAPVKYDQDGIAVYADGYVEVLPGMAKSMYISGPDNENLTTFGIEKLAREDFLRHLHGAAVPLSNDVAAWIIYTINGTMSRYQGAYPDFIAKAKLISSLSSETVAQLILSSGRFAVVESTDGNGGSRLYMQNTNPDSIMEHCWEPVSEKLAGMSGPSSASFHRMIALFSNASVTPKFYSEVYGAVVAMAARLQLAETLPENRWLVPFIDGIRDTSKKRGENGWWIDWDSPRAQSLVFTSKMQVWYHPEIDNYPEPQITRDDGSIWTPDWQFRFMAAKDPDNMTESEKEVYNAMYWSLRYAILHNVDWGVAVLYQNATGYSSGNNGKSMLLKMITAMYNGRDAQNVRRTPSIPLDGFDKDVNTSQLDGAACVLTDETPPEGRTIKHNEELKTIIVHGFIKINQKYRQPFTTRASVSLIFCTNGILHFEDQTDSMGERFLIIPFSKDFARMATEGQIQADPKIKSEYMIRDDVMTYYCRVALDAPCWIPGDATCPHWKFQNNEKARFNAEKNNVTRFLADVLDSTHPSDNEKWVNDYATLDILYDIYVLYCEDLKIFAVQRETFDVTAIRWAKSSPEWEVCLGRDDEPAMRTRVGKGMKYQEKEYVILRYAESRNYFRISRHFADPYRNKYSAHVPFMVKGDRINGVCLRRRKTWNKDAVDMTIHDNDDDIPEESADVMQKSEPEEGTPEM